jgi:CRISPR-associated protein Csx3
MKHFPSDDIRSTYKGRVVAIGGPPHSGKSVFLNPFHNILLKHLGDLVFLERGCPDGEGKWSAETNSDLVQKIRQKAPFSSEFMQIKLPGITNLGQNKPLVLIDLGGKRSPENAEILARATDLIILSAIPEEFKLWSTFATVQGCHTIACFTSTLQTLSDGSLDPTACSSIDFTTRPISGTLINLDRHSSSDCYLNTIETIAQWLIQKIGYSKST